MLGKMIFTTNDHLYSEMEVFPSLKVPAATVLEVKKQSVEGHLGFGVAITPSSCYELSLMDKEKRHKLLTEIYTKEGLGLSLGRLCIGSSDYSPEIYSYDDVSEDLTLEHFSVKRDEKYVIPIIKEILEIKPDLYLFAAPWSPPYWMKTGGSMCGGYMREKYLDCYSDYIVKFIEAYREYGINISAITPQNETNTQQNGRMPACLWHPETEAKFIVLLKEKFKNRGLDIKLWMYDHDFMDVDRVLWSLENCEGLCESVDGVGFHYYSGTPERTAKVKEAYPDLDLHFTEAGPRLTDNYDTDFVKWGLMVAKTIKLGYSSFTGWNLMLNELGGPNVGPFIGICGGLVTLDHRTMELSYSGQYKAYNHIAKYITKSSKLYPISSEEAFDIPMFKYPSQAAKIEGFLIDTPNERKVAVLVNPNGYGIQSQIEVGGILWYCELQPGSISTIIFDI